MRPSLILAAAVTALTLFHPKAAHATAPDASIAVPDANGRKLCVLSVKGPYATQKPGAGYLRFNTVVSCLRSKRSVTVRVHSELRGGPKIGPRPVVAQTDTTRTIRPGHKAVVSTPRSPGYHVRTDGWFIGYASARILRPGSGELASVQTPLAEVDIR